MATQTAPIKAHPIKVYYHKVERIGKSEKRIRHWLHPQHKSDTKNNFFYSAVRDLKQTEAVLNQTINTEYFVNFIVNWNPKILEYWEKCTIELPLVIVFNKKTFKIITKPDEYNYQKDNMKIQAVEFTETQKFDSEEYDD